MKRKLRHPVRAIREPFGKAGLVVACIALIAALSGTALAAKSALSGKQKKEVERIAKKFAGKAGPAGAPGPQGNPGPAGAPGKDGTNGSNGVTGESVTITPQGECTKFSNASGSGEVCNGQTGFTEVLPREQTESGDWSLVGNTGTEENVASAVSFVIPLEAGLDAAHVHFILENGKEAVVGASSIEEVAKSSACPGTAAAPQAQPGSLCVYTKHELNSGAQVFISSSFHVVYPAICKLGTATDYLGCAEGTGSGTDASGFGLATAAKSEGTAEGYGTWAVTAE